MTILPADARGLARITGALRDGEAVLIPFPSPLPYVVAATDPAAVNEAKGRPRDQPCGILVGAADDVAPHLDLDRATLELGIWITQVEQANLLVPLLPGSPRWLSSAAVRRFVGVTLAWAARTRPLAEELGHLFVSSANLTSRPVAVTAPEADRAFGGERLVLDGDSFRDARAPHGSATIIQVQRGGRLHVVRNGINNRGIADHAAYLETLRDRFAASRPCRDEETVKTRDRTADAP